MLRVLLVTVTKVEANAVLELFPIHTGQAWSRIYILGKAYYSLGRLGGVDVFMVQSEMGSLGPGSAIVTVLRAIQDLKPTAVIMVGIAFGIDPSYQTLGDILVSRYLRSYEQQKIKGRTVIPRGDRVFTSTKLLGLFRDGDLDWTGARVHFGLILSGEKLVMSRSFRTRLLKIEPEAIGGEMEGAGLYTAANESKVDWILVKAICDWADETKNYDSQPLAAKNAVSFVIHVLKHGGLSSQLLESLENSNTPELNPEGSANSEIANEFKTAPNDSVASSDRDVSKNTNQAKLTVGDAIKNLITLSGKGSNQNPSIPFLVTLMVNPENGILEYREIIPVRNQRCYWGRGKTPVRLASYMSSKGLDPSKTDAVLLPPLQTASGNISPTAWLEIFSDSAILHYGWGTRQPLEEIMITDAKNDHFLLSGKRPYTLHGFERIRFSGNPVVEQIYIPPTIKLVSRLQAECIELMESVGLWASAGYAWLIVGSKDRALFALKQAVAIGLDNNCREPILDTIARLDAP